MKYCFDTNIFIDLWRRSYPPDIFPAVWVKIEALVESDILVSTEEVLYELEKSDDELLGWAKARKHIFLESSEAIQQALRGVLAKYPGLINLNKNSSMADPYIIAVAQIHKCTVVTNEKSTNNMERPHIPDVCKGMGVRTIGLLGFMKEQGWVF